MPDHAVVIAGGGPTGLMLAGELALAGEVFDQRGIAERFLSQGQIAQVASFSFIRLDISDFPTRHNYVLALRQNHIESIMADWVGKLPVTFYRGVEVTGFSQGDAGVDVNLSTADRCTRSISPDATEVAA
jgi:3-(3-hydroxy-phenyl)propionate hydroxylase